MFDDLSHALQVLETCGVAFAHIPAGEYEVGHEGEGLLVRPPQIAFVSPTATQLSKVSAGAFWISKEPLRLSQWRKIVSHPDCSSLDGLVPSAHLKEIAVRRVTDPEITVAPSASEQQSDPDAQPRRIAQQVELDPVLTLDEARAAGVAEALGASLPRWYEWEIATRGPRGWRYPWGDEMSLSELSLEVKDYSVDEESVMGYYSYDQDVVFIRSFGSYADQASPYGLTGLARPGREWNLCHDGQPTAEERYVLRSISDLGGMAYMVPGIRPRTWGGREWPKTYVDIAFSGPILACYAPPAVGVTWDGPLYREAGFRLVYRGAEPGER
jgi:formylglycine-generating enzyme required for sulfatase activity